MTITKEISLKDFVFWGGAAENTRYLTREDMEQLDEFFEDNDGTFSGTPTETDINDLFWFETDYIAELLGFENWDGLCEQREG